MAIRWFFENFMLGAFALGLVLTCRCALRLALGSQRAWPWTEALVGVAAMTLIGILVPDAIAWLGQCIRAEWQPLPELATFGLAVGSAWLYVRSAALRLSARELVWQPAAWLLLVLSIGATSWAGYRFYEASKPAVEQFTSSPQPRSRRDKRFVAFSDLGREIPLYVIAEAPDNSPRGWQPVTAGFRQLAQTIIVQAKADAHSNCHGWVFAEGRFLLDGQTVQILLEDNGYQPTNQPQPGDVIVYRDSAGLIRHTGLVRGVLLDGTVLVESKWNLQERFLHRPEDQPYASDYTYYHSHRGSHRVTIQSHEGRRAIEHISRSDTDPATRS